TEVEAWGRGVQVAHGSSVRWHAVDRLDRLEPGQAIVYRGNRVAVVSDELAAAYQAGDHVLVDPSSGQMLHVPADEHRRAASAVDAAVHAFGELGRCTDAQITAFFEAFAARLADDATFEPIAE